METRGRQIEQERVDELLKVLRARPMISQILERLKTELPKDLYYHSASHTEDVLREAVLFSLLDGRSDREIVLLATAAAYHDAGFLSSPVDNERIGAELARKSMQEHGGFTEDEMKEVEKMILDTRLVQTPAGLRQVAHTELSKYLLDADLGNLGRQDFFEKGELLRKELGFEKGLFLQRTFELISNHRWNTNVALTLRQNRKEENIKRFRELLEGVKLSEQSGQAVALGIDRLGFLAKLPLLLNSSMDPHQIIEVAIDHLRRRVGAEAATVFLLDEFSKELTFWAMRGGEGSRLSGLKMPANKGIVGWVIERQESALVSDVAKDPRFFSTIDKEGKFTTKNLICVPLSVRGSRTLGAIQVLNKEYEDFTQEDLLFVEQFSHQVALAIDNAMLFEALTERNRALETLDRRKTEMVTVIGHEFRTPLNVIQSAADMLSSDMLKDSEARRKMSQTLARGVERLTKLIAQIRNVSLLNSKELKAEQSEILVADMLHKIVAEFGPIAEARKLSLKLESLNDVKTVRGDLSLLLIVFKNLLSNAIRFTADGGSIDLRAIKQAGLVRFEVQDTGIGIAEEQIPLIFEKFYEVGDAMAHSSGDYQFKSGGLGLGLASVRSILNAHGATIEVDSTPGKGSTFSFSLPIGE